ncbi:hypothetical protein HMPREF1991_02765 [Hoylesella loescheii DSM 19665 = JCM 12249 = ATCC 15930]|uniref:Uncharacterized protein n=1 Tax=Hoylesella loescheii DSM 19665 = JCM 12249 = ATCC 15930 TaxID=1122985 RepID=A0A069QEW6_HOYLO|nr:hypothetical protein HMPREF1991_02765 [Hoylesella loescheii DSM 19665 = JCM 12249 = ATCC 15930]
MSYFFLLPYTYLVITKHFLVENDHYVPKNDLIMFDNAKLRI